MVVGNEQRVDAWSNRRLPFEPKGPALEFRTQLHSHLASLRPRGVLRCVYGSADRTFCDAENVLLYNVGMSAFTRLVASGLVFERTYEVPTRPTAAAFAHHHSYATSDAEAPGHWAAGRVVASWQATVPSKRSSAAAWWLAVASSVASTEGELRDQPFGLRIRVASGAVSIQSALKAMLDGTIAALHWDPMASHLAVERLGARLGVAPERLFSMLVTHGPLGPRPALIRPYRDGIQWNPADDLCVSCSVTVDPRLRPGVLTGEVVEVVQRWSANLRRCGSGAASAALRIGVAPVMGPARTR